jgi:hypothetical protein
MADMPPPNINLSPISIHNMPPGLVDSQAFVITVFIPTYFGLTVTVTISVAVAGTGMVDGGNTLTLTFNADYTPQTFTLSSPAGFASMTLNFAVGGPGAARFYVSQPSVVLTIPTSVQLLDSAPFIVNFNVSNSAGTWIGPNPSTCTIGNVARFNGVSHTMNMRDALDTGNITTIFPSPMMSLTGWTLVTWVLFTAFKTPQQTFVIHTGSNLIDHSITFGMGTDATTTKGIALAFTANLAAGASSIQLTSWLTKPLQLNTWSLRALRHP